MNHFVTKVKDSGTVKNVPTIVKHKSFLLIDNINYVEYVFNEMMTLIWNITKN